MKSLWLRALNLALVGGTLLLCLPLNMPAAAKTGAAGGSGTLDSAARIDYVTKLSLIQGHLWVAAQLVEAGHADLGARHAKHPEQEVYQELMPFMAATNSAGFARELQAMSSAFHADSAADFRRAYVEVMGVIDAIVRAQGLNSQGLLQVAVRLVEQAAVEFQAGVKAGGIVDLQEYQDARGFVEIAEVRLRDKAAVGDSLANESGQQARVSAQLAATKNLWPSLVPKDEMLGDGAELRSLAKTLGAMQVNEKSAD